MVRGIYLASAGGAVCSRLAAQSPFCAPNQHYSNTCCNWPVNGRVKAFYDYSGCVRTSYIRSYLNVEREVK